MSLAGGPGVGMPGGGLPCNLSNDACDVNINTPSPADRHTPVKILPSPNFV